MYTPAIMERVRIRDKLHRIHMKKTGKRLELTILVGIAILMIDYTAILSEAATPMQKTAGFLPEASFFTMAAFLLRLKDKIKR